MQVFFFKYRYFFEMEGMRLMSQYFWSWTFKRVTTFSQIQFCHPQLLSVAQPLSIMNLLVFYELNSFSPGGREGLLSMLSKAEFIWIIWLNYSTSTYALELYDLLQKAWTLSRYGKGRVWDQHSICQMLIKAEEMQVSCGKKGKHRTKSAGTQVPEIIRNPSLRVL